MSINPLSQENFENYTIKTHTHRVFSSSSTGQTGDLRVFSRASDIEKDTVPAGDNMQSPAVNEETIEKKLHDIVANIADSTDIFSQIESYMIAVNGTEVSKTRQKSVGILRFEPSVRFTKDTGRKNTVRQCLFPFYSGKYRSCEWSYPNYHTINFFTSSDVPTSSVLIYPAASGTARPVAITEGNPEGFPYSPHDSFSFEFWINPRYTADNAESAYTAGTILHLSSSYAISLVTGSSRDEDEIPTGFRIMLQLSESANIPPSSVDLNSPPELVFVSSDNSLTYNNWHHVAIRWGGLQVNAGTGSFVIDGKINEEFCLPYASVMPMSFDPPISDPDGLFVGNFFEQITPAAVVSRFFNVNAAYNDGIISFFPIFAETRSIEVSDSSIVKLTVVNEAGPGINLVVDLDFKHVPGNPAAGIPTAGTVFSFTDYASNTVTITFVEGVAEDNQISIDSLASTEDAIEALKNAINTLIDEFFSASSSGKILTVTGLSYAFSDDDAAFSDPPTDSYYLRHPLNAEIHEIKIYNTYRSVDSIISGSKTSVTEITDDLLFYLPPFFTKTTAKRNVLQTPFQSARTSTNDPFNVALSFGIGGREINLPNFLKEFVQETHPRLLYLTASEIAYGVNEGKTANDLLYESPNLRKANLTILPNDNGLFYPNYTLLSLDPENSDRFVNRFGEIEYSKIRLDDMVSLESIAKGTPSDDDAGGFLLGEIATPEDPGLAPGNILTILNRTRDTSSNEVVFFDASNLYYGNQIKVNSLTICDPSLTGSGGKVSICLKDNGIGGLYRADCLTKQANWNEVGAILYEEGLLTIKSPNLPMFGKDRWDIEFDGEHNVYVMEVNIPCAKGQFNSSSNPNWQALYASDDANLVEDKFCYITGLNLHDENFNVIARMNLAQPVVKKESDKYLFRVKIDF